MSFGCGGGRIFLDNIINTNTLYHNCNILNDRDISTTNFESKSTPYYYTKIRTVRSYYPGDTFILKPGEWINVTVRIELWYTDKQGNNKFIKFIDPRGKQFTTTVEVYFTAEDTGSGWKWLPYNQQTAIEGARHPNRKIYMTNKAIHFAFRVNQGNSRSIRIDIKNLRGPDIPQIAYSYTDIFYVPAPADNMWQKFHIDEINNK
jgi:hypothetical protein